MAKRPKLKIVAHFIVFEGKRIEIEPGKTDLPDRCKLALAEMVTGNKYEFKEMTNT